MIIDEIIKLKKAKGIDFNETYAQQLRHYKGALRHGVLEYIYDGGVVGFIEWVRLPKPPKRDFCWADCPVQKGPYLYIINSVSLSMSVSKELKRRMDKKNKSAIKV